MKRFKVRTRYDRDQKLRRFLDIYGATVARYKLAELEALPETPGRLRQIEICREYL